MSDQPQFVRKGSGPTFTGRPQSSSLLPSLPLPTALGATLLSLVAALLLAGSPLGIGVPIFTALLIALSALTQKPKAEPYRYIFAALGLLLMTMPAIRTADWLITLDIIGGIGLLALAGAGGKNFIEVLTGLTLWVATVFSGPIALIKSFFSQRSDGNRIDRRRAVVVLRSVVLSLTVLLIFGGLLSAADRAFAEVLGDLIPNISIEDLPTKIAVFILIFCIAGGLLVAAALERNPASRQTDTEPRDSSKLPLKPAEWVPALVLLNLLFAGFIAVQIRVLYGGHDHVLQTAGLTYAKYARSGFYELVVAAFLVLATIAIAYLTARRTTRRHDILLRALLGLLCALTFVVMISALKRIGLLEDALGLTRTRFNGHALSIWLTGLFVVVLGGLIVNSFRWLPRVLVIYTALALTVMNIANPETIIARKNIDRFQRDGQVDLYYLSKLGSDAVPAIVELDPQQAACALKNHSKHFFGDNPWVSANLSRHRAYQEFKKLPEPDDATCNRLLYSDTLSY